MTTRVLKILTFASLAALLEAQTQGTINGPVAGYVFDKASQSLRPVLGLPGSSLLGSPVSFGFHVSAAFVAPRLDTALAVASDGTFHLFRIQNGAVQEVSLSGLGPQGKTANTASLDLELAQRSGRSHGPSFLVSFSPSGSAMALYAAGAVQIVTGLPGSPTIAGSVSLRSVGAPNAVALSDDGTALLVSANRAVRLFGSYADMGNLMDTAGSPAMAFAAGGHDAAVSDPNAGVVLFHDLTGVGNSQIVAPPEQSGTPSSALAFSADEKSIYIANSLNKTVTQLDLSSATSNHFQCSCSPTLLARMGNVFRLTELATDPLWLLNQPEGNPSIVFVPALVPQTGQ
jgi:hypothetical protein